MSDRSVPETPQAALARARRHALAAAAESVAALHALLDAAALAGSGQPAATHRVLAPLAGLLQDLARELAPQDESDEGRLLTSVLDALDEEIARWELRAQREPEARAVLRTLLGLREILWEVGVRPANRTGGARARPTRRARDAARMKRATGE